MAERVPTRSGSPRFCQHLRIFDCDLVDQVIERRAGDAFDDVFLVAVELPLLPVPDPLVNGDGVNHQRISLEMSHGFAVDLGIRVPLVWVDYAERTYQRSVLFSEQSLEPNSRKIRMAIRRARRRPTLRQRL